jgi:hypothetical protein
LSDNRGYDMTKRLCILVILSLLAAFACMTSTTGAQGCPTCGAEENWGASAASFLEGKSIDGTTAPKWGPAVARETNSQFSSDKTEDESSDTAVDSSGSEQMPDQTAEDASGIVLKNVSASPNPANPGSPVSIAAVLGETTSAYALIRNFSGVQVGNVTLEQASGEEYVGNWAASIATGAYRATIIASGPGESRTFEDALQIDVVDSNSDSGNSRFKKLG